MTQQIQTAFLAALIFSIFMGTAYAQTFYYQQIEIEIKADKAAYGSGESGKLVITLEVPWGYGVSDLEGVFGISVQSEVEGVTFGELAKPEPDHFDEIGGYFLGMKEFTLPFDVSAEVKPGEKNVKIQFQLQACDMATGMRFKPTMFTREGKIIVVAPAPIVESSRAEPGLGPTKSAEGEGDSDELLGTFEGALTGGNLWLAFIVAFIAGIFTSLTPCVYPMIPVTISYVSGRSGGSKRNGFLISLVLVLGIAITYSILGITAGATGGTFGAYLSHPLVQAFLLVVLVAMGFSMLGVWEIALPASVTGKAAVHKQGYLGALGVGLTLGIVAAPCVGPILVAMLLFIAQTQDYLLGFWLMFVYAIGIGMLFIFIGTFSNAVLPKSGEWMNWLKKIFAFVFFIMAVIYAHGLINLLYPDLHLYLIGALLVTMGTAIGAFFCLDKKSNAWEILGKALGLLLVATGMILFTSDFIKPLLPRATLAGVNGERVSTSRSGPAWINDFEVGLQQAQSKGKPLLVDVWAEWCIACHELDEFTFSDSRVIAELERFVVVKVDGTSESDPNYLRVKSHFAEKGDPIMGLPAVFILNSNGEIETVVNKFIDAEAMLATLKRSK